jgi:hypothetical protein
MTKWWLVVSVLAACGDNIKLAPDAAPDASPFGAPSTTYPAFAIGRPQVIDVGGPSMKNVRVVPIFFADDPDAARYVAFLNAYAASPYWPQMVGEYGVGSLTIANAVTLSVNAPANLPDSDLQTLVLGELDGTHPEVGPIDATTLAGTIYLFHAPSTTNGSSPQPHPLPSCTRMFGYHFEVLLGSNDVTYAIAYDCPPPPFFTTSFDLTTAVITHEIVEAVSDPEPFTMPAYAGLNYPAIPWALASGDELGDMCEAFASSWVKVADLGYAIQRTWSNNAALAFHDPCVPVPPSETVYFAAVPDSQDTVVWNNGSGLKLPGTRIVLGETATVEIDFASSGPTDDWAIDVAEQVDGAPVLDITLDRTTGQNGNLVHASIKTLRRPLYNLAYYRVRSTLGSNSTYWWGAVEVP